MSDSQIPTSSKNHSNSSSNSSESIRKNSSHTSNLANQQNQAITQDEPTKSNGMVVADEPPTEMQNVCELPVPDAAKAVIDHSIFKHFYTQLFCRTCCLLNRLTHFVVATITILGGCLLFIDLLRFIAGSGRGTLCQCGIGQPGRLGHQ